MEKLILKRQFRYSNLSKGNFKISFSIARDWKIIKDLLLLFICYDPLTLIDFNLTSNGKIYDMYGKLVKHFPYVPQMLDRLTKEGYVLAAASR